MRYILLVAVSTLNIAAAPSNRPATPPMLWNGITYGMSVSDILVKKPGSVEKIGKILLPKITVDGTVYYPEVKIIGGNAAMVTLRPEQWTVRDLLTSLSSKYNNPIQQWACTNRNGAEDCQAAWRGDRGLRVTLTYTGVFGEGVMDITYTIANVNGI